MIIMLVFVCVEKCCRGGIREEGDWTAEAQW
jgi:hypothetical protein